MLETYGKRKFIVYILIKEQKQIKALVIISYYKTANKYSDNAWAVALTEMRLQQQMSRWATKIRQYVSKSNKYLRRRLKLEATRPEITRGTARFNFKISADRDVSEVSEYVKLGI